MKALASNTYQLRNERCLAKNKKCDETGKNHDEPVFVPSLSPAVRLKLPLF
jgi:hypothetical protein